MRVSERRREERLPRGRARRARGQRFPAEGTQRTSFASRNVHSLHATCTNILALYKPATRESSASPSVPLPQTCQRAVVERVACHGRVLRASRASQRMTAAAGFVTVAALARNPHRADVRAATTRWLSTLAASEWLRHSTEGYCATTEAAGPDFSAKDCRTGHNGGSVLPPEVVERGWLAAATECVSRCAGCERCRFISVSLKERDCRPADSRSYFATISHPASRAPAARDACSLVRSRCNPRLASAPRPSAHPTSPVSCRDVSWYHACDQDQLRRDVSSFRSGGVLGNASAQEWGALGERIASHPGTERDELDRLQTSANSGKAVLETVPAPVPPPATLFLGVISGDVKRRRCPAPTLPCARRASHTAPSPSRTLTPSPSPSPSASPAPLQTLAPLPVRRATDHPMHVGARAVAARVCRDADLPRRAAAAGPLGGRRA